MHPRTLRIGAAFVVAAAFLTDSFQSALRTQAGRGAGTRVLASFPLSEDRQDDVRPG